MISCIIRGDLGSQLFQVYATIAYAMKYNQSFLLYYNSQSVYPFYWKNIFLQISHCIHDLSEDGSERFKRIEHVYIQESADGFSTLMVPMNIHKKNVLLDGYFQDKRYSEEYFNRITSLLHIYELQVIIREKYKSLLFSNSEYSYIGIYIQVGVGYIFYDNELNILIGHSNKNICILLFYDREDEIAIDDTLTDLTANYAKYKIVNTNKILRRINIDQWEQMLILSVCNKVVVASGTLGWWAAEYNRVYSKIQ